MKKLIFVLLLLILIPATVLAWDDCPYGETDCPSPGTCGKYVDADNDKICDHSQLTPENRNVEITNTQEINNKNLITDKQSTMTYHLMPISLLLILLYFITHILAKKKIISVINHRKIWNILLLISFLLSGVSGILLIININFGGAISLPSNILFLHVETGIAMFVISIFHTLWHWAYFKNMLRIKK